MKGERRRRHAEALGDHPGREPFRAALHEEPENLEAGVLREGTECVDGLRGLHRVHTISGEVVDNQPGYSQAFGEALVRLAEHDDRVVAITAAMCAGTGLEAFATRFPRRFCQALDLLAHMAVRQAVQVFQRFWVRKDQLAQFLAL